MASPPLGGGKSRAVGAPIPSQRLQVGAEPPSQPPPVPSFPSITRGHRRARPRAGIPATIAGFCPVPVSPGASSAPPGAAAGVRPSANEPRVEIYCAPSVPAPGGRRQLPPLCAPVGGRLRLSGLAEPPAVPPRCAAVTVIPVPGRARCGHSAAGRPVRGAE